MNNSLWL